ncbi:MAG: undecaprenyldiphospho-muramoylpentapeptide beta-N-acetylglucosaminyltransferase [Gammaproteobacteria bacterium]
MTRILIMAGGTGGHVFPALAVAEELKKQGHEVLWLGTRAGLEAKVIPSTGLALHFIAISGLRGKGWWSWVFAPYKLGIAFLQSLALLMKLKPNVVLGMGGFVAGPAGFSAWLLDKTLVIHEQNANAGLTNRWLAPLADKVLEAFPGSLAKKYHPIHTGNPVRAAITQLPDPEQRLAGRGGALRLLVLGGSLGAQVLNETLPQALQQLREQCAIEVWHQAGARHIEDAQKHYNDAGVTARITSFIEDMAEAYAWADLVVCRAGALTVAELTCVGLSSILVPYPFAADDHQTANARYLEQQGAACLLAQDKLTPASLAELLKSLCNARQRLLEMAQAARRLARPEAAMRVAELCLEASHA